jgi:hypothetical protein
VLSAWGCGWTASGQPLQQVNRLSHWEFLNQWHKLGLMFPSGSFEGRLSVIEESNVGDGARSETKGQSERTIPIPYALPASLRAPSMRVNIRLTQTCVETDSQRYFIWTCASHRLDNRFAAETQQHLQFPLSAAADSPRLHPTRRSSEASWSGGRSHPAALIGRGPNQQIGSIAFPFAALSSSSH